MFPKPYPSSNLNLDHMLFRLFAISLGDDQDDRIRIVHMPNSHPPTPTHTYTHTHKQTHTHTHTHTHTTRRCDVETYLAARPSLN